MTDYVFRCPGTPKTTGRLGKPATPTIFYHRLGSTTTLSRAFNYPCSSHDNITIFLLWSHLAIFLIYINRLYSLLDIQETPYPTRLSRCLG